MTNNKKTLTLPDEIVFGSNGKNLLNWLRQEENDLKDAGVELIKSGDTADGNNKVLQSSGISEIIDLVEAMRRGLNDKNK